jgi:hypothetical protein
MLLLAVWSAQMQQLACQAVMHACYSALALARMHDRDSACLCV